MRKVIATMLIIMVSVNIMWSGVKKVEAAIPAVVPIGAAAVVTAALIAAGLEFDTADEAAIAVQEWWDDSNERLRDEVKRHGIQAAASTVFISAELWSSIIDYTSSNYIVGENTVMATVMQSLTEGLMEVHVNSQPVPYRTYGPLWSGPNSDDYIGDSKNYYVYELVPGLEIKLAMFGVNWFLQYVDDGPWKALSGSSQAHVINDVYYTPDCGFENDRSSIRITFCSNTGTTVNGNRMHHGGEFEAGNRCSACNNYGERVIQIYPDDMAVILNDLGVDEFGVQKEVEILALPTAVNPDYDWVNSETGERSISHPGSIEQAITLNQSQVQSGEVTQSISLDMPVIQLDEIEFPAFPETITIESLITWIGSILQWFWEWLKAIFEMIIGLLQSIYVFVVKGVQTLLGITAYLNPDSTEFMFADILDIEGVQEAYKAQIDRISQAIWAKLPNMDYEMPYVNEQQFSDVTCTIFGITVVVIPGYWVNEIGNNLKPLLSDVLYLMTFFIVYRRVSEIFD